MPLLSAPTLVVSREEWADTDFDIPEGEPIHAPSDKDDFDADEDWDLEMDLGSTGGAKAKSVVAGMAARSEAAKDTFSSSSGSSSAMITIRPPLQLPMSDDDEEDGVSTIKEGASTLKASGFPLAISARKQPLPQTIDEDDFEDGFALPSDLTQLSLAPVAVSRRGSKASLEWGEKDNTSSSQSSDAYSSLGFADNYQSSTSASSASLPETETEDDEDDLDGLVIPTALFESKQSSRQLNKILETKKKAEVAITERKVATPHPEEDFEAGLVIEDDIDLSPSKLIVNAHNSRRRTFNRSNTHPPATRGPSGSLRPPSRAGKPERSKSPSNPPPSSARQLQKLRLSPSPPLIPPSRSQSYQPFSAVTPTAPSPTPSSSSSFLSPKLGSLRNQKSHSGLKPPTPPSTTRLARKASLSVIESVAKQSSRTSLEVPTNAPPKSRYEEPTAASRAKSHKSSTSRMHDFRVPPTRPSTPSSNPAALRLTMPTQSRTKSRPALSQVFGSSSESKGHATTRAISPIPPLPPRAPSSMSLRSQRHPKAPPPPVPTPPPAAAPKLLRRPKRTRTYGDGTELDALDDLPLDADKESRFRVQPKGYGNRVPGATYEKDKLLRSVDKPSDFKGSLRKSKRDAKQESILPATATSNTLRRTATRIEFSKPPPAIDILPKRKKGTSPGKTQRKPTLIRNLGGAGGLKVVGDMVYNPATLRWDGNDQVLRDFDAAMGTSTRPALITQLTGSSGGSPAGSFANGARIVGTMFFDPTQMRWISTLPPEEDEPDVFANLADTEDDSDSWERKGDTIRALQPRVSDASSIASCASTDSRNPRSGTNSPTDSHSRTLSDAGSDRGSRASMVVSDVDEAFVQKCREAEARHWSEMKGWKTALTKCDPYDAFDRSHLYEIRALATRKY